ncbi:hypothetical protein [Methylorubrum zatmanii]|uniref:Uncharacterized protein n=1 Tax=Methylorubrum zatmanii TaxID=29429 RepID=A0ABW1WU06_9HYPH
MLEIDIAEAGQRRAAPELEGACRLDMARRLDDAMHNLTFRHAQISCLPEDADLSFVWIYLLKRAALATCGSAWA